MKEIQRKKLKEHVRKGVPVTHRVKLWLDMGVELSVPLNLNQNIFKVLGHRFPHLEYVPYLKNFIQVVNTVLDDQNTLNFVASLIMNSKLLVNSEYTQMVNATLELSHGNKNSERMLDSFFSVLPLSLKYRLIDSLLIEGPKIFIRFCLATLHYDIIPEEPKFTKKAFAFHFSDKKIFSARMSTYISSPIERDFPEGTELSNDDWSYLWHHVPHRFQSHLPYLLFTTKVDGYSLSTLYMHIRDASPMIMVIKTMNGDVFGCYMSDSVSPNGKNTGTGEMFVFTISPHAQVYKYNTEALESDVFLIARAKELIIGSSDKGQHAIWLHSSLTHGFTGVSNTFSNSPLVADTSKNGFKFEIATLAVYSFK